MSNIVQLKRAVKLDMTNRSSDVRSVRQLSIEAMRHVLIDARAANSAAEGSEARMVAAGVSAFALVRLSATLGT